MSASHHQRGLTLPQLLGWIVLLMILISMGYCGIRYLSGATKQRPTAVMVNGPVLASRGATLTYTLTLDFAGALSTTGPTTVNVEVWEKDTFSGDTRLIDLVRVGIPANRRRGTTSFSLSCAANGDLVGANGTAAQESEFTVYGFVPDQPGVHETEGSGLPLRCVVSEETP